MRYLGFFDYNENMNSDKQDKVEDEGNIRYNFEEQKKEDIRPAVDEEEM